MKKKSKDAIPRYGKLESMDIKKPLRTVIRKINGETISHYVYYKDNGVKRGIHIVIKSKSRLSMTYVFDLEE